MRETVIYVIGVVTSSGITGPIKVGITNSIQSRLASLQTGNPKPLAVYFATALNSRAMVAMLEEAFHRALSSRRLVGEWFDMTPGEAMRAFEVETREYLLNGPCEEIRALERKYGIPVQ